MYVRNLHKNKQINTMNLPKVIVDLAKAQNNFDSVAYANCFSETATVFDEGRNYKGKIEVRNWIENANREYNSVMKPLEYNETNEVLKAEVSGNFPGSPIVLSYHFKLKNGFIESLKITG